MDEHVVVEHLIVSVHTSCTVYQKEICPMTHVSIPMMKDFN